VLEGAVTSLHVESYSGDQSSIETQVPVLSSTLMQPQLCSSGLSANDLCTPFGKRQKVFRFTSCLLLEKHAIYEPERVSDRPTFYPPSQARSLLYLGR
jgi:hypothetical protein